MLFPAKLIYTFPARGVRIHKNIPANIITDIDPELPVETIRMAVRRRWFSFDVKWRFDDDTLIIGQAQASTSRSGSGYVRNTGDAYANGPGSFANTGIVIGGKDTSQVTVDSAAYMTLNNYDSVVIKGGYRATVTITTRPGTPVALV